MLEALAIHLDWDSPTRLARNYRFSDEPGYWRFQVAFGVRRRFPKELRPQRRSEGYTADFYNPYFYIRILGLCFGLGASWTTGKDNPPCCTPSPGPSSPSSSA